VRTYEAFKDADYAEAEISKQRAEANEEEAIENKIYDTAEEMRRLDELDQLKSLNKREAVRYDTITQALSILYKDEDAAKRQRAEEEDAADFHALLALEAAPEETIVSEEFCQDSKPQPSFLTGYSSSDD
jgi:hypothetical protein